MSTETKADRITLAVMIHRSHCFNDGCEMEAFDFDLTAADAILASDWLRERDGANVLKGAAQEKSESLRAAAAAFRSDMARAWGGDQGWLTTGDHVAHLAADVLDEMADDYAAETSAE
ncbi:MAG: hypothetical protein AB7W59_20125 [Acidimicrobiia bacterium]